MILLSVAAFLVGVALCRFFRVLILAPALIYISSACFAASPSGTTIPAAQQITDSNGGVWTVDAAGRCYLNAVQASNGNCGIVKVLLYFQGNIYVGGNTGLWWLRLGNGGTFTQIAGDPRNIASPSGTTIPTAQQIVDQYGVVWSVDSAGICYRNGVRASAGRCGQVQTGLFYNGNIYFQSNNGWWYQRIGTGDSFLQISGDPRPVGSAAVTTYHYDTLRTGWNNNEKSLTATGFPSTFSRLQSVTLNPSANEVVNAQPLVVPGVTLTSGPYAGTNHDVVYVATEANNIYMIDAASGVILNTPTNLGPPVPAPFTCNIDGNFVGIDSTPVINSATKTLYVMAYVSGSAPSYRLHALNLADLRDKSGSPVTVTAQKTVNGTTFTFDPTYHRQRPALLKLNGNIYAAFGSWCDYHADKSRGWVLGWNATTLAALPSNQLDDTQATSPTSFFLSSIWMSGYGPAGQGTRLYFATGNSDCNFYVSPERCPATTTYDGTTNIQESVVMLEGDLVHLWGTFTPSNVAEMDRSDADLGSGGVLVIPDQIGPVPMAVAAGKDGRLFLLNRAAMWGGGFNAGAILDTEQSSDILSGCWCGSSFFTGSDGIGRVVTSQGKTLATWKIQLSPSPHLVLDGTAEIPTIPGQTDGGEDPGFFTVISSNGTHAGSATIWAVGRPTTTSDVSLFAFNATASGGTLPLIFASSSTQRAGSWPYWGNANIVPVVANGKVYVASDNTLTIFGATPPATLLGSAAKINSTPAPPADLDSPHVVTGTLLAVNGATLKLQTRAGKTVTVDTSLAERNKQTSLLLLHGVYTAQGSSFSAAGALQATSIFRAKGSTALWPADK